MVSPYSGRAILKDGPTAKKIRADRIGRFARGLMERAKAPAPAPAPAKRGRGRPRKTPAPTNPPQPKKRGRPLGSRNKAKK
jgi:hypothetical protein